MVDKPGQYWDYEQCAWVRFAVVEPSVEIPAQQAAPNQTGVAVAQEADVRSG